jgi:hypothetical protein
MMVIFITYCASSFALQANKVDNAIDVSVTNAFEVKADKFAFIPPVKPEVESIELAFAQ